MAILTLKNLVFQETGTCFIPSSNRQTKVSLFTILQYNFIRSLLMLPSGTSIW